MLHARGTSLEGRPVTVSGSGTVALHAIEKAQVLGATVVAFSDSSGSVVDEAGVDVALLRQVKEVERGWVADHVARRPGARIGRSGSGWDVPTDVALPSATQNELGPSPARSSSTGWSRSPRGRTCRRAAGRGAAAGGRGPVRPGQGGPTPVV